MKCPECGEILKNLDDVEVGEIVECANCGLELEVVYVNPVKLRIFEEEEK